MDEVVETYLPSNDKISKFFLLPDSKKVKVVELGLSLYENGLNKVQYMNNEEWQTKMEEKEQIHMKEKKQFEQNLRDSEERFNFFIKKNNEEKDNLISEVKRNETLKFNEEISQTKQINSQLTTRLSNLTTEFHNVHVLLDNKWTDRLQEKQDFYENKLQNMQKRIDETSVDYEKKIDIEKQKWESVLIRTQNSTIKGQDGEGYVFNQLNLLFPKAEIEDTHKIPSRGDFIMREQEFTMMIENKNYTKNVQKSEVDKFYRDIDNPANKDVQCAVLISLHSGICCKSDYEFEVRNGKPVLFLHRVQNDMQSLMLAVKFFKLIISQNDLDLSNKEVVGSFKNLASSIKRNYSRQRSKLDKYHAEHMKLILEQETHTIELYGLLKMNYSK